MARAEVTPEERPPSPSKMVTERLDDGFRAGAGREVDEKPPRPTVVPHGGVAKGLFGAGIGILAKGMASKHVDGRVVNAVRCWRPVIAC